MRTIKFKGKCIKDDSWVFGDLCHVMNYVAIKPFSETFRRSLVDPRSVCEFTGFLDRDGKEIYEGDILNGDSKSEIVFTDGVFAIRSIRYGGDVILDPLYYFKRKDGTLDCKVIGNKFDE